MFFFVAEEDLPALESLEMPMNSSSSSNSPVTDSNISINTSSNISPANVKSSSSIIKALNEVSVIKS